jgi:2-oxoglutarate dehydrogenase E2 component (dihydrolipoamide succinyltransferase)
MRVEVKIPVVGESIVEVQIGQWLKSEGEEVQKDQPLAVIESEKATVELPAPESGKLTRILCQAGDTVHVGTTIAQIETDGAAGKPQPATAQPTGQPSSKAAAPAKPKETARALPPDGRADIPVRSELRPVSKPPSPSSVAADRNVRAPVVVPRDTPTPTKKEKPGGSKAAPAQVEKPEEPASEIPITEPAPSAAPVDEDVPFPEASSVATEVGEAQRAPTEPSDAPAREEEVVPMSMLRRTVARRLVEAQRTMAMLTTFSEVDMSAVQALRHQHQDAFQQRYGIKLGLMSFFVKAAIAALKEFPQLNAETRGDDIIYRNYFDIGVAIATPQGLVVPVLLNAERLSFAEVESAVADFAQRAKERQLKPGELQGGTFTITNGGVFGSLLSTPLINPPQSGILGLHAIEERPVAREGQVVIRPMMYVALTYDHRIVDGREAVLFLRRIKDAIESPARMLIEV